MTELSEVLRGRRAVVTGAGSGIGLAVVRRLVELEVEVLAISRGWHADAAWAQGDPLVECREVDVRDREGQAAAIAGFTAGDRRLDLAVTCAGIYGRTVLLDELDPDDVAEVFDVNVLGTLWTVQAAMPHLRRTRGSVVCVGSIAGRMGGVAAGAHYAASKGAVHTMVRSLAKAEAAHGVRANAVAPGATWTPMIEDRDYSAAGIPLARFGTAAELAESIIFLGSSLSAFTTGAVLDVNGGMFIG